MSKCNCTPVSPCDCENVSSLRGKSAYEIWVLQQGPNDDTSLEAFMEYMKGGKGDQGDKGDTGDSAYQIWLAAGNTGTQQDFLDSLVGVGVQSVEMTATPFQIADA